MRLAYLFIQGIHGLLQGCGNSQLNRYLATIVIGSEMHYNITFIELLFQTK